MDTTVVPRGHAARLHFGTFLLDLDRAELHRDGALLALRPKAFALLSYLARHPQRILAKDELLGAVWPDVVVTDDSVSQCVSELRAVLDDRDGSLIKTVPRRGYLFDAAVRAEVVPSADVAPEADAQRPPSPSRHAAPGRRRLPAIVAAALAGVTVALAAVASWVFERSATPMRIDAELALRRSIAVMPFTDLSDPKAPHFAEGIMVELITDLGRLRDALSSPAPRRRCSAAAPTSTYGASAVN